MSRPSRFCKRIVQAPFENLIAGLAFFSGLVALFDVGRSGDPLDAILPGWAATVFQLAYVLSGLTITVGLGAARSDVESFGLVTISTSQIIRAIATAALIGMANAAISAVFAVLVVWACWVRLRQLLRATREVRDGG